MISIFYIDFDLEYTYFCLKAILLAQILRLWEGKTLKWSEIHTEALNHYPKVVIFFISFVIFHTFDFCRHRIF